MRGKAKRTRTSTQVVCVVLLLALLCGMLALEAARAGAGFFTEGAAHVALPLVSEGTGVLFREETALLSSNNGPVAYEMSDGDEVEAGALLALVYSDDSGSDKRARASGLYTELERLEGALAPDGEAWQRGYGDAYAALMERLSTGDLRGAGDRQSDLSRVLDRRAAERDAEACAARADTLRAEAEDLVRYVDEPQRITAAARGRFFRTVDGCEALCAPSAASGLSPEALADLLASPLSVEGAVGKWVPDGPFTLAFVRTAREAADYRIGGTYPAEFLDCGVTVPLTLSEINPSADGASALLVFTSPEVSAPLDGARRQRVRITRATAEGLSVPASALCLQDGVRGVYVLEEGVARFRRVEPVLETPFGVLAAADGGEGALAEGDRILLGVRRLYEGKRLR